MKRRLNEYKLNHIDLIWKRGEWRKFNPYNPYIDEKDKPNKI